VPQREFRGGGGGAEEVVGHEEELPGRLIGLKSAAAL